MSRPNRSRPHPARRRVAATTDKARAGWFQMRAAWPAREAPVTPLGRAREAARQMPAPSQALAWDEAGPTNVGGRMTCAVAHPQDPETLWAGAAAGGVWKSTDGGRSWRSVWDDQPCLNVGALAVDPQNPDVLYCGTGEANLSSDSYAGVGLYKSEDGGETWAFLAPAGQPDGLPRRIGAIAVDPFDPLHLRIGTIAFDPLDRDYQRGSDVGLPPAPLGGMYASDDGGQSWWRETFLSEANHWCHAVVFDPQEQGTIYATFTERGARNGVWRVRAGGYWEHLEVGLPYSDELGRMSLALAPSDPRTVYALADWPAWRVGFFVSYDGGDNWQDRSSEHFAGEKQMSYNNTLAVHPMDQNRVLCGGVHLHLTADGGKTWTQVTDDWGWRGRPDYAHPDHHALIWHPGAPHTVYDFNDGGMDVFDADARRWENRSDTLAVTMYYDVDVAQSDARRFGGGTQDNGTLLTLDGAKDRHFEAAGGDGGWTVIDPKDADHFFTSYQNLYILRFRGSQHKDVTPHELEDWEHDAVWMAFLAMDPKDTKRLFVGSTRIWRTTDDGESWQAVSYELDGSAVTAIEVARDDPSHVYVGTEKGGFFRSLDGGSSWSSSLQGADLPGRTITRIRSHPQNAAEVYLTVANFGVSHVFHSPDKGSTWQDLDAGQLPDAPCNSLEVVAVSGSPDKLIVASDAGVFASTDRGTSWLVLSHDLPSVNCTDLVYHEKGALLLVATYGRGLWRLKLPSSLTP